MNSFLWKIRIYKIILGFMARKLQNDDVEKYLIYFKLRTYIMNTWDGIILYGKKIIWGSD